MVTTVKLQVTNREKWKVSEVIQALPDSKMSVVAHQYSFPRRYHRNNHRTCYTPVVCQYIERRRDTGTDWADMLETLEHLGIHTKHLTFGVFKRHWNLRYVNLLPT